jgi:hypothetical protein
MKWKENYEISRYAESQSNLGHYRISASRVKEAEAGVADRLWSIG